MIANVDKTIEWLEANNLEHWQVSTTQGDNSKVFETVEDETIEDRKSRFRRVMEYCTGNRFVITAWLKAKSGRGAFREEFKNLPDGVLPSGQNTISGVPGAVSVGAGYVAIGELERRLVENEQRIMMRVENERLKAELQEANEELREKDTAFTRTIEKLEPYLGTILGNTVGRILPQPVQVGVAGVQGGTDIPVRESENTESDQDIEQRLENALQAWSSADKDFYRIIEIIAELARTNQSFSAGFVQLSYQSIKEMLVKSDMWK